MARVAHGNSVLADLPPTARQENSKKKIDGDPNPGDSSWRTRPERLTGPVQPDHLTRPRQKSYFRIRPSIVRFQEERRARHLGSTDPDKV